TVTDPIDLVLSWAKELAEAGKVGTAYEMAEVVQKNLPSDPRPLQHLIRLSAILGDADKEAQWWQRLVTDNPKHYGYKAALAAKLMNAGRDAEARTYLEEVQATPAAKGDPEVLFQLGRAWAKREPITARG